MDWSFNLWLYHQGTIFHEGIDVLRGDFFFLSIWIWAYGGPILFHGYVLYACGDIHVIRQLSAHLSLHLYGGFAAWQQAWSQ